MMDLATIVANNRSAANRARKAGKYPVTFEESDKADRRAFTRRLPYIGDWLPRGWARVTVEGDPRGWNSGDADGAGAWFVDASGWGAEGEPALTQTAFLDLLEVGRSYAVVEAGQFQVKVGVFRKKS